MVCKLDTNHMSLMPNYNHVCVMLTVTNRCRVLALDSATERATATAAIRAVSLERDQIVRARLERVPAHRVVEV